MTQIESELIRLQDALRNPRAVASAELLVEELAARAFENVYRWDPDRLAAIRQQTDELKIIVTANESRKRADFVAKWIDTGTHHHSRNKEWGTGVAEKARSVLEKASWQVRAPHVTREGVTIEASIAVEDLVKAIPANASAIEKVEQALVRQ
jgi:hypothetical protein